MAYLLILMARWVIDLVMAFSRTFRPTGGLVVIFEFVYMTTDPPLKLLRRFIPLLRVGNVQFDLGFLLLVIVIIVLQDYAQGL
jgi:YggT family protein